MVTGLSSSALFPLVTGISLPAITFHRKPPRRGLNPPPPGPGLAGTMLGGVALDVTTRLMDGDVMSAALLSGTVYYFCFLHSIIYHFLKKMRRNK